MSQYYLMSQLPSLDGINDASPIPITEKRFYELCHRFLGKKALNALDKLTLIPPRSHNKVGFKVIDSWNEWERNFRLALGSVRANRMQKKFDTGDDSVSIQLLQMVRTVVDIKDPMEAEKVINRFRMEFVESLRPADYFCDDAVFYYGLKLKLILRMRQFDEVKGKDAYRNIYDSILRGE